MLYYKEMAKFVREAYSDAHMNLLLIFEYRNRINQSNSFRISGSCSSGVRSTPFPL